MVRNTHNEDDDGLIDIGGGHYRRRPTSRQTQQLDDFLHELNHTDRNIGKEFYDGMDPEEWHERAERRNRDRKLPDLLRGI